MQWIRVAPVKIRLQKQFAFFCIVEDQSRKKRSMNNNFGGKEVNTCTTESTITFILERVFVDPRK